MVLVLERICPKNDTVKIFIYGNPFKKNAHRTNQFPVGFLNESAILKKPLRVIGSVPYAYSRSVAALLMFGVCIAVI